MMMTKFVRLLLTLVLALALGPQIAGQTNRRATSGKAATPARLVLVATQDLKTIERKMSDLESQAARVADNLEQVRFFHDKLAKQDFVVCTISAEAAFSSYLPKGTCTRFIASQVLTGQMTPEQAQRVAARIGELTRAHLKVLGEIVAEEEDALNKIKLELAELVHQRDRILEGKDISGVVRPPTPNEPATTKVTGIAPASMTICHYDLKGPNPSQCLQRYDLTLKESRPMNAQGQVVAIYVSIDFRGVQTTAEVVFGQNNLVDMHIEDTTGRVGFYGGTRRGSAIEGKYRVKGGTQSLSDFRAFW